MVLVFAIGIFIAVYLSQKSQDIEQHASTDASLVALVDNQPITKEEIKAKALEQYSESAVNQEVLINILNNIIETKLINSEAAKRGIQASDDEVLKRAKTLGGSASAQTSIRNQAHIDLLKEKLGQALTKTRQVESVGFWLPPANYGVSLTPVEAQVIASQKSQKETVLTEIKLKFDLGEEPLEIAQEIQKKYPLFAPIIAVNGYIVAKTADTTVMTSPKLYTYQDAFKTNDFLQQIFTMNNGEVNVILTSANAGGVVVKIIDGSNGQYSSFEDWLEKSKSLRTKILKQP